MEYVAFSIVGIFFTILPRHHVTLSIFQNIRENIFKYLRTVSRYTYHRWELCVISNMGKNFNIIFQYVSWFEIVYHFQSWEYFSNFPTVSCYTFHCDNITPGLIGGSYCCHIFGCKIKIVYSTMCLNVTIFEKFSKIDCYKHYRAVTSRSRLGQIWACLTERPVLKSEICLNVTIFRRLA